MTVVCSAANPASAGVSQQETPQQASAMYGAAIYSRMAQVKQAYDPDNMFRSARNITPASAARG